MSAVNRVIMVGELENTPTTFSSNGKEWARFVLVTTSIFKRKKDDEPTELKYWHRIVVSNPFAVESCKTLTAGDLTYVEGRLRTRKVNVRGSEYWVGEVCVEPFSGKVLSIEPGKGFSGPRQQERPDNLDDWEAGGEGWFE